MSLTEFHPAVSDWFADALGEPTPVQAEAWPAIRAGGNALIAAPTGSGKTLAAFLSAIDGLVREGVDNGGLPDETAVLYVSPLRALSNDIQRNLQVPIEGIREKLAERLAGDVEIRAWVRTGDTPASERERMRKRPPHIVVTTPESLYLLLTSESGRRMLSTVRSVIVDEIHALAGSKRGSHLALSLQRLEALRRSTLGTGVTEDQAQQPEPAPTSRPTAAPTGAEPDGTAVAEGNAAVGAGLPANKPGSEAHPGDNAQPGSYRTADCARREGVSTPETSSSRPKAAPTGAEPDGTAVGSRDEPVGAGLPANKPGSEAQSDDNAQTGSQRTADCARREGVSAPETSSSRPKAAPTGAEPDGTAAASRDAPVGAGLPANKPGNATQRSENAPPPLQRIGLSATQNPIEDIAAFLTGDAANCRIIDTGHTRERDIALEVPGSPLEAIMSNEVWEEVYDRLAELVREHRTTLIFVNTRRLAERATRFLAERLGEDAVTSHHGSLAREHRLDAEQKLKSGQLRALVATASLELGIDIGDVDLVCQLGTPRSMSALLQRVGRSGHGVGRVPKGRLFPLTRDDLLECSALADAVVRGELDRILIPQAPLDVLSQQIVAEVAAAGECGETALYETFRGAWVYRDLAREDFDEAVQMLADGFTTRRGRRGAYIHRDAVHGRLRPRRNARITALTNGGAIPDQFDYDVQLQPGGYRVGTVNEDFAFESMPGDVFQLGNTSYRILKVESGKVLVEDAKGAPPSIPFWFGEAPGRTEELSNAVSRLLAGADAGLANGDVAAVREWLIEAYRLPEGAAEQLATYLAVARVALGALPTQDHIILERFFDEVGDMHMVVHSPFGSRINRAWGLALRKRFCRRFNFELQASALEDSIILSLGPTHSFPLEEVSGYLKSATAKEILVEALIDVPMFATRWRWAASIALAVQRNRAGKKRPPQWQRQDAEDLLSVVSPDQLACPENLSGPPEIPDHPLVNQALHDCLTDNMDVDGFLALVKRLETGDIQVSARDLAAPSPLAEEVVNARPYAFLDGGEAEERRTRSVNTGGPLDLESAENMARPDPQAVERVRAEVWPTPRDADELADALHVLGFLTETEGRNWQGLFEQLARERRASAATIADGKTLWIAAERLAELQALHPGVELKPHIDAVGAPPEDEDAALVELLRSRLEGLGPVTQTDLVAPLGIPSTKTEAALARLQTEGFAVAGRFTSETEQWCERGLLARIHRYSIQRRRSESEPVTPQDFMRFLLDWHGLTEPPEGPDALAAALEQLEGFPISAAAWERDILPSRIGDYAPHLLDQLLASGRFTWLRLLPPKQEGSKRGGPVRQTPIAIMERESLLHWRQVAPAPDRAPGKLSSGAARVLAALDEHGASFFMDLVQATGLLKTQVEEALGELVYRGLANADTFNGIRALVAPSNKRPSNAPKYRRRRGRSAPGVDAAGRWVRLRAQSSEQETDERPPRRMTDYETLEHIAWTLLHRYGVVFRKILEREPALPPWRELLYAYRRLEARGEIKGGRFVQQFSGEQFAHPEAAGELAKMRRKEKDGELVAVSAADPLNVVGIVTPGSRLPASGTNRVLYQDGVPVAFHQGGEVRFLEEATPQQHWEARERLLRSAGILPQAGSISATRH